MAFRWLTHDPPEGRHGPAGLQKPLKGPFLLPGAVEPAASPPLPPATSLGPAPRPLPHVRVPTGYSAPSTPRHPGARRGCFPRPTLSSRDHRRAPPPRRVEDAAIQKVYICPRLAGTAGSGEGAAGARLSLSARPRGEGGGRRVPGAARRGGKRYSL